MSPALNIGACVRWAQPTTGPYSSGRRLMSPCSSSPTTSVTGSGSQQKSERSYSLMSLTIIGSYYTSRS